MRVQSFETMESKLKATSHAGLDFEEVEERKKMLEKYNYSILVEGAHDEFDRLEKWMKQNSDENQFEYICYAKTGYDFGFVEYFVSEKEFAEKLNVIVPRIFTANAYPSKSIYRSNGYDSIIEYDGSDSNAIVLSEE